jgi:hypothetical protein
MLRVRMDVGGKRCDIGDGGRQGTGDGRRPNFQISQ